MPLNPTDGRFGLDCWTDADSKDEAAEVFSDDLDELKREALRLLRAGSYRYLILSRWDEPKDEWIKLEEMTPDDLGDS